MSLSLLKIFLKCMKERRQNILKELVFVCGNDFHSNKPLKQVIMMLSSRRRILGYEFRILTRVSTYVFSFVHNYLYQI